MMTLDTIQIVITVLALAIISYLARKYFVDSTRKQPQERKEILFKELKQHMEMVSQNLNEVRNIIYSHIAKYKDGVQTHSAKILIIEYELMLTENNRALKSLQKTFTQTETLIKDIDEEDEMKHLLQFQNAASEIARECKKMNQKMKQLKEKYKVKL